MSTSGSLVTQDIESQTDREKQYLKMPSLKSKKIYIFLVLSKSYPFDSPYAFYTTGLLVTKIFKAKQDKKYMKVLAATKSN